MIEIPTVLILGAGASNDFGFPLGRGIFEEIRDELKDNRSQLWKNLNNFRFDDDIEIKKFRNKLRKSDAPSVDAFLETHDNFKDLGRMAIWLKIQSYEKDPMLFDSKGTHWYHYLFEEMHTASFEDFKQNQLSIVTFNYDRSLEHYFINKLMHSWGERNPEECKAMLSNIPIIHVYGKLASLPWEGESGLPYDFDVSNLESYDGFHTHLYINEAYNQIKIMKYNEIISTEFREAFRNLEFATRIFFLGFGYHEMNLNRLNLNNVLTDNIFGTAYKWGNSEINRKIKKWGIHVPNNKYNILNFLKNEANLSHKNE